MASTANPVQYSIKTPRISSLYLSSTKVCCAKVLNSTRSLTSNARRLLDFSPLPEKKESSPGVCFCGEPLKFSGGSQQIRRRGTVDFPVVSAAAADADGHAHEIEIEVSDGLINLFSFFLFLMFGRCDSEGYDHMIRGRKFWCFLHYCLTMIGFRVKIIYFILFSYDMTADMQSHQRALVRDFPHWSLASFSLCGN